MIKVRFFTADVVFVLKQKKLTSAFLPDIFIREKKKGEGNLNYIFCSDTYLLALNEKFLQHRDYTDILTFEDYDEDNRLISEIYISLDRVRENARSLNIGFYDELHRVMIHGVLHICGYPDHGATEKIQMRKLENKYLRAFNNFVSRET